jgi:long-chain acyl-CoA synthetase
MSTTLVPVTQHVKPWLATYEEYGIAADINPDIFPSVVAMMDSAMNIYPDRIAFCALGQTLTYGDVDRLSGAFAAALQNQFGVKKGDRIAVMLPNIMAFPVTFLGIARAGAIQVNVNPLYTPRELAHQLRDSGAEIIIIFGGSTPTLAEIIGDSAIKHVMVVDLGDATSARIPSPPCDPRLNSAVSFRDVLSQAAAQNYARIELDGSDILLLQYTGGTTGVSKGAVLSHRNIIANVEQFKGFMSDALRPGQEVIVTAIPLYHIMALTVNFVCTFSIGATNWLYANPRDMDGLVATLSAAKPSIFNGVNTLYGGLCLHPKIAEVDFSNLRLSGGGGSAVLGATAERWRQITGRFICEGYGLSETSPCVAFNPAAIKEFTGTTGMPVPSTDIKLLDESDAEVAIGDSGEICVKGPQVMRGYWHQPEANAAAFTADGYFRTGDIGVFNARGFLKIVDRKKDMILVSGFNVYPNEIEDVATACPGVAECACIGVADEKTGEAVKLFVVKAPGSVGAELSPEAVISYCRTALTGYKMPKSVHIVEALPKSAVGKILRRELRDWV